MTIKEAAERYRIPTEILDEYESWGFCGNNDGNIGVRQYDQTDIERLSLIMVLHDVGFSGTEAERYMRLALSDKDTSKELTEMLRKKRNGTLDEIHIKQEQLDRLDFLRFEITKSNH